jgi:hypothetical protein
MKRPVAMYAGAFVFLIAINAIVVVWGGKRPVGAFFEQLVAGILYWGILIGSIGGGLWSGTKLHDKTNSKLLGWIGGFAVFMVIGTGVLLLSSKIPGVGWRLERMIDLD